MGTLRSRHHPCHIAASRCELRSLGRHWAGGGDCGSQRFANFFSILQFSAIFCKFAQFFAFGFCCCVWLVQLACLLVPFACSVSAQHSDETRCQLTLCSL